MKSTALVLVISLISSECQNRSHHDDCHHHRRFNLRTGRARNSRSSGCCRPKRCARCWRRAMDQRGARWVRGLSIVTSWCWPARPPTPFYHPAAARRRTRYRRRPAACLDGAAAGAACRQMIVLGPQANGTDRQAANAWNKWRAAGAAGGALNLTPARRWRCWPSIGGRGFAADRRMIIRFENHLFFRQWARTTGRLRPVFRFNPRRTGWTTSGGERQPAVPALSAARTASGSRSASPVTWTTPPPSSPSAWAARSSVSATAAWASSPVQMFDASRPASAIRSGAVQLYQGAGGQFAAGAGAPGAGLRDLRFAV